MHQLLNYDDKFLPFRWELFSTVFECEDISVLVGHRIIIYIESIKITHHYA